MWDDEVASQSPGMFPRKLVATATHRHSLQSQLPSSQLDLGHLDLGEAEQEEHGIVAVLSVPLSLNSQELQSALLVPHFGCSGSTTAFP